MTIQTVGESRFYFGITVKNTRSSSPGANAVIHLDYNPNDATSSSFTAANEIVYKGTLDVAFKEIDARAGSKSSGVPLFQRSER